MLCVLSGSLEIYVLCVVWVYYLGNLEISSVADLGVSVIGPHVMSSF